MKIFRSVALSVSLLVGCCGGASAMSAHNAQTGGHTSNSDDTAIVAYWQQRPNDKRLDFELQLKTATRATEQTGGRQNIIGSGTLSPDALERLQNEN